MKRIGVALALASLGVAGCKVSVDTPPLDGAMFICSSNADCPEGQQCNVTLGDGGKLCSGAQHQTAALGDPCATDANCGVGFCVHAPGTDGGAGVCCSEKCAASEPSTCGMTGACDLSDAGNFGNCAFYGSDTVCAQQSCTGSSLSAERHCPGGGANCPAAEPTPCPNGASCDPNGVTCVGTCTVGTTLGCGSGWCHAAADGGTYCAAGQQQDGEACNLGPDCTSQYCDTNHHLCCSGGTCCSGSSTATCPGNSSVCDNPTGCTGIQTTWSCVSSVCTSTEVSVTSVCDGTSNGCGAYVAVTCPTPQSSCPTSCNPGNVDTDSLCAPGNYCYSGQCLPKAGDGQLCSPDGPHQSQSCLSGHCDNGICCQDSPTHQCCRNGSASDCGFDDAFLGGSSNFSRVGYYWTCDQPDQCQGSKSQAACVGFVCQRLDGGTPDDTRCHLGYGNDYLNQDKYVCGDGTVIACDGTADQNPAASCP